MADKYDGDLYGDFDLDLEAEDLDAEAQLEDELVDPPDLDQPATAPPPPAAASANQVQSNTSLPLGQQGQSNGIQNGNSFGDAGGNTPGGGPGGIDRIRPSDMPDEGKMFIGGLNWETTDDGLRAYFAQFGQVDACTIMRDPSGRSRGFAFLTFKDPASVTAVMSKDHSLDGKMIDPKRAIPRAEHERTAKVFVGGLAATVTSESLKVFLTQFGQVMDATVMFDRDTGRSKGFAFATFADESAVENAMVNSGIELDGKQIEIKRAQPRGAGNQPKTFGAGASQGGPGPRTFNQPPQFQNQAMGAGMGGAVLGNGMGGFDPNAMAMMYQNMMKGSMGMGGGMAGGMGGFDPNAMAMMYQNMMKNMTNAPAINPNMAANMMNQRGGMGMGGMGMGNMGMNGMMGGMNGMGMAGMGGMGMGGYQNPMAQPRPTMGGAARPVPNAPRGPAAMRAPGASGVAAPMAQGGVGGVTGAGSGPQRYSTQGAARSKPY